MAFFKTKQEKEIMAQMERDEQLEVFNDQIKTLKAKREEYATIAAEAEINGDKAIGILKVMEKDIKETSANVRSMDGMVWGRTTGEAS